MSCTDISEIAAVRKKEKNVTVQVLEYTLMITLSLAPRFLSSSFQTGPVELYFIALELVLVQMPYRTQNLMPLQFILKLVILIVINLCSLYFTLENFRFDDLSLSDIKPKVWHKRPTQLFMYLALAILPRIAMLIKTCGVCLKLFAQDDSRFFCFSDKDLDVADGETTVFNIDLTHQINVGSGPSSVTLVNQSVTHVSSVNNFFPGKTDKSNGTNHAKPKKESPESSHRADYQPHWWEWKSSFC